MSEIYDDCNWKKIKGIRTPDISEGDLKYYRDKYLNLFRRMVFDKNSRNRFWRLREIYRTENIIPHLNYASTTK